jgi:hypothetical protein
MAGQWVEPGGGVPMALMSGRQAVQLLCADEGRLFRASARRAPQTRARAAEARCDRRRRDAQHGLRAHARPPCERRGARPSRRRLFVARRLFGARLMWGGGSHGVCWQTRTTFNFNKENKTSGDRREWDELAEKVEARVARKIRAWADAEPDEDWDEVGARVEARLKRKIRAWLAEDEHERL